MRCSSYVQSTVRWQSAPLAVPTNIRSYARLGNFWRVAAPGGLVGEPGAWVAAPGRLAGASDLFAGGRAAAPAPLLAEPGRLLGDAAAAQVM